MPKIVGPHPRYLNGFNYQLLKALTIFIALALVASNLFLLRFRFQKIFVKGTKGKYFEDENSIGASRANISESQLQHWIRIPDSETQLCVNLERESRQHGALMPEEISLWKRYNCFKLLKIFYSRW
jgi:hypothetical protein